MIQALVAEIMSRLKTARIDFTGDDYTSKEEFIKCEQLITEAIQERIDYLMIWRTR